MTNFVGILNLTPDSFFDGGRYNEKESALTQLKTLILSGANVIDVGAESTRPNAIALTDDEEWERIKDILPDIIEVAHQNHVQISLDSRHPKNVSKALDIGIDIINDVSGFEDEEMVNLAVTSGKKIVVMHSLGIPADKNKIIDEEVNVVNFLSDWMRSRLLELVNKGVKIDQVIFDPGIGFGKNSQQSIQIIKEFDRLKDVGLPIYIGHSNKSFLDDWNIDGCHNREEKTKKISQDLMRKKVDYLRTHLVS
ncbi:MAG: dihydropteroate synthase [Lentimonas sp.]|jgi:dihydropteroate synthase